MNGDGLNIGQNGFTTHSARYSLTKIGLNFVTCEQSLKVPPMPVRMCKYVDWNCLASMLAAKRSAGVAPEVN